jgi:hypothetical protein
MKIRDQTKNEIFMWQKTLYIRHKTYQILSYFKKGWEHATDCFKVIATNN